MHRLLSRLVSRPTEVKRAEPIRTRTEASSHRPPEARKRCLNEAAHKQHR